MGSERQATNLSPNIRSLHLSTKLHGVTSCEVLNPKNKNLVLVFGGRAPGSNTFWSVTPY